MAAPANDNFEDATPVVLVDGIYTSPVVDNADATRQDGTPPEPLPGYNYRTCWWDFTPEHDGTTRLDTELTIGTDPDTTLQVLTGASITTLSEVGYNDDQDYDGGIYTSRIDSLAVTAGTTYHIVVGQYIEQTDPLGYVLRLQQLTTTKTIRPVTVFAVDATEHGAESNPSIFGPAPWSDEDDATYVDFNSTGIANLPNKPIETRQDTARAIFEQAGISGLTSVTLRVRGYSTTSASSRSEVDAQYLFRDVGGAPAVLVDGSVPENTVPEEWSWTVGAGAFDGDPDPVTTAYGGFTLADLEERLNAGADIDVWLNLYIPGTETMRVHEFRLELHYGFDVTVSPTAIYGIPPLRQLQRGDGHAMSGAPRAIQNTSQQASLRNIAFQ